MNKSLLLIFFILSLIFSTVNAQEKKDSLASPKTYPLLHEQHTEYSSMIKNLHYEDAIKAVNTKINEAKRKKQDVSALEEQLELLENGLYALQATNKIVFIDSVVVNKAELLSAYKFDEELGTVSFSADKELSSFTNELGNFTYRTEKDKEGNIAIYSYYIEDGKSTNKAPLCGIELSGDMNYPFLLSDGSTLYFASRDTEGLGNYDLYVTRFDKEDGTYLQPTNLGFPFNSYANDYLMIVDDDLGIGWFASDRYQPAGKVCVYTFLKPNSRHTYDFETDSHAEIINAARISSIRNTWKGHDDDIRKARQELALKLSQNQGTNPKSYDFTFVVNDTHVYHFLSEFKNKEAKSKFSTYLSKQNELDHLLSTLSQLRLNAKGETIRKQISDMERQVPALSSEIERLKKEVRQLELK